ncbi:methyltransferase [Nitratireductor aquimarinus]|uniref:methyltransferase n=1 Tax=Alphaproteobacteria TaxID=28211 RepID=UPI0019D3612E|nr:MULTISPECIES: methyltransferase [Alphaproteobacteria]MBN7758952.1 methyltransferase [Nitratireductor aquimarinus]MBY6001625.1 hypothetical protein [Tritonibacter mobilis]MBY6023913.1 methyltransferase [Nitratireductor sp. DP7N14-4]
MAQNTSSAVMQQRSEPNDSLDDFPTPPWATRALLKHVIMPMTGPVSDQSCWEPACNRGHMARPLGEFFREVVASDVHDYGTGHVILDFLFPGDVRKVDWIITNPPFRLAQQFIDRSSQIARHGFAMIVRSAFLEGVGRFNGLFSVNPPSIIAQFTERVVMVKGRLEPKGSTATAYCWLVWIDGETDTRFQWIPPCRKRLERPEDYQTEAA